MKVTEEQNQIILIELHNEEAQKLDKIIGKIRIDQISADQFEFVINFKEKLKEAINESV